MKWLTFLIRIRRVIPMVCILCLLRLEVFYDGKTGECIDIKDVTTGEHFECSEENKIDTGCWDEDGNTELCSATMADAEKAQ